MNVSDAGASARMEVSRMFQEAERKRDYPGSYFPALNRAETALKAWKEKYPKDHLLLQAEELDCEANEIEDNYCDLDGSLTQEAIDRLNIERETKRVKLRAQADELRAQASLA